jgi:protoheme IX farnesyltransferase
MAPNVWGERETMRQMLFYTALLIPITLAPVAYGGLGFLYAAAALVLGGWFLFGVVRVMRAPNFTQPAWALYKSSLLYLALLFGAMVVDGVVPTGRLGEQPTIILRNPDIVAAAEAAPR